MASSRLRAFILRLARLTLIGPVGRFIMGVLFYTKPDTPSSSNTNEGLEVIACGFPRSGTFSLKLALARLGLNCYHGSDFARADLASGAWAKHANLWLQAATEENWNKWEKVIQGYSAVADYPAAFFYKQLMAAYPNAKVILNVRDPDQWHRSCMDTTFRSRNSLFYQVFRSEAFIKVMEVVLWQGKFKGRFAEKEFAINVYKSHVEEVKRIVPEEKLLVYETTEGWAPLCKFLQLDVPDTPFPFANDRLAWRNRVKERDTAFAVFSAVYVGLLSCALALLLKWGFRFSIQR